jgi:hypothetical protein
MQENKRMDCLKESDLYPIDLLKGDILYIILKGG